MLRRSAAQPFYVGGPPPFCGVYPMGLLMLDLLGTSKSLEITDFLVLMKNMCVAD